MDINAALELIEKYVEALESHEWTQEYEKAARSMFDWMREYGCGNKQIREAGDIIGRHTGYRPEQIRALGEAIEVKQSLYGALNSEALGRKQQPRRLIDRLD
ncbi:MAG: hypothetical protein WBB29_06985 [Geitlerinemataceae cyanobacterium]